MSKAAVGEETFQPRGPSVAGNLAHRDRHGPRRHARAGRLRDRRRPPSRSWARRADYPITPKEHGVDYLLDRRHLWIRSERQQAILRVRHEVIDAIRDFFNDPRLHPGRHADLHAGGVRGHDHAVPGRSTSTTDGVPDAERPALQRGQRHGARARLLLRPDVPRREIEDAAPPHRVLDGRARDGLRDARRRDGARRGPRRVGRGARARPAAPRADDARARHREARARQDAVPAHLVRRGREAPQRQGAAVRVGRRPRRHRRDRAVGAVRSARWPSTGTRRPSRRST